MADLPTHRDGGATPKCVFPTPGTGLVSWNLGGQSGGSNRRNKDQLGRRQELSGADGDHEDHRLNKRLIDVVNAGGHRQGSVQRYIVLQPGRKALAQRIHQFSRSLSGLNRVRAGELVES